MLRSSGVFVVEFVVLTWRARDCTGTKPWQFTASCNRSKMMSFKKKLPRSLQTHAAAAAAAAAAACYNKEPMFLKAKLM